MDSEREDNRHFGQDGGTIFQQRCELGTEYVWAGLEMCSSDREEEKH